MEVTNIRELIALGEAIGIFQFYLPFLIATVVIFALLQKSAILGAKKRIDAVVSLAIAAYVMAYTPIGLTVGQILATLFGSTFLILITLAATCLILVVLLPIFGVEWGKAPKKVFLPLAFIALMLWAASGLPIILPAIIIPPIPLTPADLAIIMLIVITGLVIYWITK